MSATASTGLQKGAVGLGLVIALVVIGLLIANAASYEFVHPDEDGKVGDMASKFLYLKRKQGFNIAVGVLIGVSWLLILVSGPALMISRTASIAMSVLFTISLIVMGMLTGSRTVGANVGYGVSAILMYVLSLSLMFLGKAVIVKQIAPVVTGAVTGAQKASIDTRSAKLAREQANLNTARTAINNPTVSSVTPAPQIVRTNLSPQQPIPVASVQYI